MAQLRPLVELGVSHFMIYPSSLRTLERFSAEVAPVLARSAATNRKRAFHVTRHGCASLGISGITRNGMPSALTRLDSVQLLSSMARAGHRGQYVPYCVGSSGPHERRYPMYSGANSLGVPRSRPARHTPFRKHRLPADS